MASKGPKTGTAASTPKPRAKAAPAKAETVKAEAAPAEAAGDKKSADSKPVAAKTAKPRTSKAPAKPAAPKEVKKPAASAAVATAQKPAAPVAPAQAEKPVEAVAPAPAAKPVEPAAKPAAETPKPVTETAKPEAEAAPAPVAAKPAPVRKKETTAMTTMEAMTEKTQTLIAEMNDRAKTAMEKNAKMVEEINEFTKGNVEAFVESSRIAAKGLEAFGQEAAEYGRKSFESATAALKAMASAKSPTDLMKLQSDFARQAFDSYVAEASKSTEAMLKLAGDAAQPISSRVAVATEKMKVAA